MFNSYENTIEITTNATVIDLNFSDFIRQIKILVKILSNIILIFYSFGILISAQISLFSLCNTSVNLSLLDTWVKNISKPM